MIEAYRVVGVELRTMEKATDDAGRHAGIQVPGGNPETLADLGITKKQSFEFTGVACQPAEMT